LLVQKALLKGSLRNFWWKVNAYGLQTLKHYKQLNLSTSLLMVWPWAPIYSTFEYVSVCVRVSWNVGTFVSSFSAYVLPHLLFLPLGLIWQGAFVELIRWWLILNSTHFSDFLPRLNYVIRECVSTLFRVDQPFFIALIQNYILPAFRQHPSKSYMICSGGYKEVHVLESKLIVIHILYHIIICN